MFLLDEKRIKEIRWIFESQNKPQFEFNVHIPPTNKIPLKITRRQ
jgi:hypothetical protein